MTPDDQLYRFRQRAIALAQELGSVRAAYRAMGIHHSTFYRWKKQAERFGLEMLRPRERRPPRPPQRHLVRSSSSASSPSHWGTPASVLSASPPSWRVPSGEAFASPTTASGAS